MGVEGVGGAPLRQGDGGRRKQLGRVRCRWGRKERNASISLKLPGEANTNKQHQTAQGGERERKEKGSEARQELI